MSYRRNDTGGHAGRLYDGLAARFGAQNVFHDLSTIHPGVDFRVRVADAIARTDITLVVIGTGWLTAQGPNGRRLDDEADYVRLEVTTALALGERVVPVLVGGAELPDPDDLPTDMRSLTSRQALSVHDDTWHTDVDALASHLLETAGGRDRRSARPLAALAIGVVVLVGGVLAASWLLTHDDNGRTADRTTSATSEVASPVPPPACDHPDRTWIQPSRPDTSEVILSDQALQIGVLGVAMRPSHNSWQVVVTARGTNVGPSAHAFNGDGNYRALVIDGVRAATLSCFSTIDGDIQLPINESSVVLVGFVVPKDPSGRSLVLELLGGRSVQVTN